MNEERLEHPQAESVGVLKAFQIIQSVSIRDYIICKIHIQNPKNPDARICNFEGDTHRTFTISFQFTEFYHSKFTPKTIFLPTVNSN
jgi:hypothetical protein